MTNIGARFYWATLYKKVRSADWRSLGGVNLGLYYTVGDRHWNAFELIIAHHLQLLVRLTHTRPPADSLQWSIRRSALFPTYRLTS